MFEDNLTDKHPELYTRSSVLEKIRHFPVKSDYFYENSSNSVTIILYVLQTDSYVMIHNYVFTFHFL